MHPINHHFSETRKHCDGFQGIQPAPSFVTETISVHSSDLSRSTNLIYLDVSLVPFLRSLVAAAVRP
ncbi:hypothetical protein PsorP6_003269 [Peronosclerospora sorghi]|uniref:Uncharacterized protein n=1 Tax=Peronosclerospora sorghi TaxID=230839 RepID=A0ACC0VRJ6_9STRA|nr:hypothetical protein PsorP6_003269 [Peronosclerospora sorghi]